MNQHFFKNLFGERVTNRSELIEVLRLAAGRNIFDKDSLPLLEAVINFGDMRAKDILLPRHEVDVIEVNSSMDEVLKLILRTGHSRFPVIDENLNDIIGVFHSKDIVQYISDPDNFQLRELLRKPLFVPNIKPLDSLLYEMRMKHSHLAVIVDEFTNVSGIVTLEMIIEQIIGEIDDEHDSIDGEHGIVEIKPNVFRVKGHCGLEQFNNLTNNDWHDDKVESVGGYVSKFLGRIPTIGEKLMLKNCQIEITNSDSRKINILLVITK